jgi:hypothetical protein
MDAAKPFSKVLAHSGHGHGHEHHHHDHHHDHHHGAEAGADEKPKKHGFFGFGKK